MLTTLFRDMWFQCNLFFMPVAEGKEEIRFIAPDILKSTATQGYIANNKIKNYPTNGKHVDAVVRALFRAKHPDEIDSELSGEDSVTETT